MWPGAGYALLNVCLVGIPKTKNGSSKEKSNVKKAIVIDSKNGVKGS